MDFRLLRVYHTELIPFGVCFQLHSIGVAMRQIYVSCLKCGLIDVPENLFEALLDEVVKSTVRRRHSIH